MLILDVYKRQVPVTVNNIDATIGSGLKLSLVDDQLGGDEISLSTTTKSLKLLKGHTYRVSSNDGGVKPLVGDSQTFTVTGLSLIHILQQDLYH